MFHQRSLRRLAAYVLLVWLFGLGSGIVNACIVSGELRRGAEVTAALAHDDHGVPAAKAAAMGHAADGHEHGTSSVPPACERLCDGAPAAAQAEKHAGNPLGGFWLAAAPPPALRVQPVMRASTPLAPAEPHWPGGVPISIAFLRLAL